MIQYDEIMRILTEDLGFRSLEAYRAWVSNERPKLEVTPALVEKLSPDRVDSRDFWRACDDLFGVDPVANVAVAPKVGKLGHTVDGWVDANRMNLRFAKAFGITAFLEENAHERVNTLEIGVGFGSLKNFIETHTQHVYFGVDVRPRVHGVLETTAEGLLPDGFAESEAGKFSYVVSTNVFQHLSARQRSRYYRDAHTLLHAGGLFIFNLTVDTGGAVVRDRAGRAWNDHYGQYTSMPVPQDVTRELGPLYELLYVTQRYDSVANFVCRRR